MTDRAKQAREVAIEVLKNSAGWYVDPLTYSDGNLTPQQVIDRAITLATRFIEHALIAEHNATVEACAELTKNYPATARAIRALLVEETVGEDSHERTEPSPEAGK